MLNDSSKPVSSAYDTVPWGPRRGVLAAVLGLIVGQIVAGLAVFAVLYTLGMSQKEADAWASTTRGQFIMVVAAEGLTLVVLWQLLKKRHPTWASFGFKRKPQLGDAGRAVVAGIVYFAALIAAASLAQAVFGVNTDQEQDIGFKAVTTHTDLIMAFASLVLLPPIVEEILFRGVLFGGLRKRFNFKKAALITSVLFAIPHALQATDGSVLWIGAIDTFILSLALCYLREKTDNLWASIMLHMLKNGVAYIWLFFLSAR
ncbi:MAG TPA: CPBP family intramembrane glutamic endopeptidase [Candidatus Saccharimonadales bacterium]|nr:CPBP family intramembrane glutamic endopeptidase [Candidatus Saccharimonadales bacterium]